MTEREAAACGAPPPDDSAVESGGPGVDQPLKQDEVIEQEYQSIRRRRVRAWINPETPEQELRDFELDSDSHTPQHERALIGLSFSGGGIRSATFALGVLQGLAELRLLKCIDYLSTVSGGGYIGGWFTAWVKREGDLKNVEQQLIPNRVQQAQALRGFTADGNLRLRGHVDPDEPRPIAHLREYSNYLAPRISLFSSDSWTLIAIYLRNLLANLLALLPAFVLLILVFRLYAANSPVWSLVGNFLGVLAILFLAGSFYMISKSVNAVSKLQPDSGRGAESTSASTETPTDRNDPSGRRWQNVIIVLVGMAAVGLTWALIPNGKLDPEQNLAGVRTSWWDAIASEPLHLPSRFDSNDLIQLIMLFAGLHGLAPRIHTYIAPTIKRRRRILSDLGMFVIGTGCGLFLWWIGLTALWAVTRGLLIGLILAIGLTWWQHRKAERADAEQRVWVALCAVVSGGIGGAILYLSLNQVIWNQDVSIGATVTLGPVLLVLAVVVAAIVEVALLGLITTEQEREWWSRLIAKLLQISVPWLIGCGVCLYGPLWINQLSARVQAALAAGWVTTTVGALFAAQSSKTNGKPSADGSGMSIRNLLTLLGPYLFLCGLACGLAWSVDWLLTTNDTLRAATADAAANAVRRLEFPAAADAEITVTRIQKGTSNESEHRTSYVLRTDFDGRKAAEHWTFVRLPNWWRFFGLVVASGFISWVFSYRVDINQFSLNALYGNRLAACYLGASRRPATSLEDDRTIGAPPHSHGRRRTVQPVTGFDHLDDFALADLAIDHVRTANDGSPRASVHADQPIQMTAEIPYCGPYPLINTALNVVGGDQLAWQERMAESYLLSPLYCGSAALKFRPTREYAGGLSISRAVAISGAAANPNMGYHTSPPVAALMTMFNVRLGWWLPNPLSNLYVKTIWADCGQAVQSRGARLLPSTYIDGVRKWLAEPVWKLRGPSFLLRYLGAELLSQTNARSKFLNITDGGHFENLGVYELVRRRCRCIVVSDAGADPNFEFEDLAGLIRKCRTDFGIAIEIDVTPLKPDPQTGLSSEHCVVGTVRYDMVDPTAPVGLLLYLKPSLTGDEPEDVRQYKTSHADFPHQPTLDQFFSESQFESYRELGYHSIRDAMEDVAVELDAALDAIASPAESTVQECHANLTENLVWSLKKRWLPMPSDFERGFLRSTDAFVNFQRSLQSSPGHSKFLRSMYSEIPVRLETEEVSSSAEVDTDSTLAKSLSDPDNSSLFDSGTGLPSAVRVTAGDVVTVSQMLQIMENTWLDVRLDTQAAHPLNSGWMNLFRRWSQNADLRLLWPLLRHEYSVGFVKFCERELALHPGIREITPFRLLQGTDDFELLYAELLRDAQERDPVGELSTDWLPVFNDTNGPDRCWALNIRYAIPSLTDNAPPKHSFLAGIIGFREVQGELADKIRNESDCRKCVERAAGDPLAARPVFELMVWVRPGFRQRQVGTVMIQELISHEQFDVDVGNGRSIAADKLLLVIRHPLAPWDCAESGLGKAGWLSFVSFYGFRPPKDTSQFDPNYYWLIREE